MRATARSRGKARGAFTLFEMLVVMAILALLVALVAPRVVGHVGKSKVTTTRTQIAGLQTSVEQFYLATGRYPTKDEGLRALLVRPADVLLEKWTGPYLEKDALPMDGWGREFAYDPGENGRYVILSLGADGRAGGEGENTDLDNRSS